MQTLPPLCFLCKYFDFKEYEKNYTFKCLAFDKIPIEILSWKFNHRKKFKNEKILFKLADDNILKERGVDNKDFIKDILE